MRYAVLLRGINVGGKHIVKMAELRALLTRMGYEHVETYIQSGNVVLDSGEDEKSLCAKLVPVFEETFGFGIPVMARSCAELQGILAGLPFAPVEIAAADAASDAESLYVAMLDAAPEAKRIEALAAYTNEGERFFVEDRNIYLLFHHSIRDSKLAAQLGKLGVNMTVRNWKTLQKLAEMAL